MGLRAGLDRCGESHSPPEFYLRTIQPVASPHLVLLDFLLIFDPLFEILIVTSQREISDCVSRQVHCQGHEINNNNNNNTWNIAHNMESIAVLEHHS